MDEETKKFFEELTHAAEERVSLEPEVAFAKTTNLPIAMEKKPAKKSSQELAELMDEGEGQLTIDVYQTPEEIVVESTIAGVNPEDLDVDISNESVTIKGKRSKEKKIADEDYFYQECYWGKFSRSIILPQEIDSENAVASIKNGVLTIRLPKLNRQRSKKLKVSFS
ncbi:MAG: Hsp20/alpha crystallin family protein [Candidatus Harrisonbacteria bacterium]|nr:Hsp20/alpha crystallin family protein [Candidatus Harrisonbacteria bacterium]